jgi:hypothetical protein
MLVYIMRLSQHSIVRGENASSVFGIVRSNELRNAIGLGGVDLLASALDCLEHLLEREGRWSICGLVGVLQGVNLSSLGVKIDFEVTGGCKRTLITTRFSSGG